MSRGEIAGRRRHGATQEWDRHADKALRQRKAHDGSVRHPDFRNRQLCPAHCLRSRSHRGEADADCDRGPQRPSPSLDQDRGTARAECSTARSRSTRTRSISPATAARPRCWRAADPPSSCRLHRSRRLPLFPWRQRLDAPRRGGGLSATAVFQAVLTSRIARAAALGFTGEPLDQLLFSRRRQRHRGGHGATGRLRHRQYCDPLACLRRDAARRAQAEAADAVSLPEHRCVAAPSQPQVGPAARVWLDGAEVEASFPGSPPCNSTPEPVIDISGASGVTLIFAMAHRQDWSGHVPGLEGLPGGYPVALEGGRLDLDLPTGVDREVAIEWNTQYEAENGLSSVPTVVHAIQAGCMMASRQKAQTSRLDLMLATSSWLGRP